MVVVVVVVVVVDNGRSEIMGYCRCSRTPTLPKQKKVNKNKLVA